MFDRRLPLPGEQPRSIWRPRQRKKRHPNRRALALLLAAVGLGALLAGVWAWRATAIPVTVVVNGQPVELRLHRRTVAGAVQAAGVRLADAVYLDPPAETPLEAGMVITLSALHPLIVHADGQTFLADAHTTDLAAVVAALGIALQPGDALRIERAEQPTSLEMWANPALASLPAVPREISVVHPQTLIVNEGWSRVSFQTTERTLGEALAAAGYALYEADRVTPPLDTLIPPGGLEVTIERATPVAVRADGRLTPVRTFQPTVGALLAEMGLALVGSDYVIPSLNAPIPSGGQVALVRVREETQIEEIPLPYQTTTIPDPDLELDQQREVQPGREGTLARQVRVRYEDGLEVSRVTLGEWTAQQPQARVVAYGTRIVIRTVRTEHGDLKYWRVLHVLATSYSPSTAGDKQPGDPRFGLSGTGAPVVRGVIAVDPRVIPLGTQLYVPGYGPGRALDVGGAVKGMRIDLGYSDEELVLWNTWVDVYLLLPLPLPDQMIWLLPEELTP